MYTQILFLVILIIMNAFFAASEIALISLNDNKVKLMAEEGNKKAIILSNLLGEPSRFLATIQIGITLAGFLASAFAAESFSERLVIFIKQRGILISEIWLKNFSIVIITVVLAYFTLVFGELVPKRLAMKKAEKISMFAARPLNLLSVVAFPFVKLLTVSTNFFVRLAGIDPHEKDDNITEEEIRMMVDVGGERGTILVTEKEMINNIFEFNNKTVTDIMTHRTDIIALPVEAKLDYLSTLIHEEKYTRIPVYNGSIDNIVGILHVKDLLQYIWKTDEHIKFDLCDIMWTPYFVSISKRIDELFKELQKNKVHMAVIIDEYGGTAGIVTIEDLIEEIVGNIFDEYDEDENDIEKLDETTYMVSGAISLDLVEKFFDVKLPINDYETLSGFIIGQIGKIPIDNENTEIEFNELIFKVEEIDDKKITRVKICRV